MLFAVSSANALTMATGALEEEDREKLYKDAVVTVLE